MGGNVRFLLTPKIWQSSIGKVYFFDPMKERGAIKAHSRLQERNPLQFPLKNVDQG